MGYWERPSVPARRRAVNVDALAKVTFDLLNEGGVRGVTARAVAVRIGTAPASIYSRVSRVEDLCDLALDHALASDESIAEAIQGGSSLELMLAWYDHLVRYPWAPAVLGARPPRGPAYLQLSERLCVLLVREDDPAPLATAYAISNFVIGSALTNQAARTEPSTAIPPDLAPQYAALGADRSTTSPRRTVESGIRALLNLSLPEAAIAPRPIAVTGHVSGR